MPGTWPGPSGPTSGSTPSWSTPAPPGSPPWRTSTAPSGPSAPGPRRRRGPTPRRPCWPPSAAPPDEGPGGSAGLAQGVQHPGPDDLGAGAEAGQDQHGQALALADQAEQEVLGADVPVLEGEGLAQAQLEHLLAPRGERDVPAGPQPPLAAVRVGMPVQGPGAEALLQPAPDLVQVDPDGPQRLGVGLAEGAAPDLGQDLALDRRRRDAQPGQHRGGDAVGLQQPEQQVLGADVAVAQAPGRHLGVDGRLAGPLGEALEHSVPPQQAPAGRVLLVDRLPAHPELGGDLLP